MGYDITEHLEEAKAACSKTYVNGFPPMLIAHGTRIRWCSASRVSISTTH